MKHEVTAKRLQYALNQTGIKQRELAERADIKESSVSHYVNGSHAPSNLNASKMAKVLNVSPLWLMGFDVEMIEHAEKNTADKISIIASQLNNDGLERLLSYAEDLSMMPKYVN